MFSQETRCHSAALKCFCRRSDQVCRSYVTLSAVLFVPPSCTGGFPELVLKPPVSVAPAAWRPVFTGKAPRTSGGTPSPPCWEDGRSYGSASPGRAWGGRTPACTRGRRRLRGEKMDVTRERSLHAFSSSSAPWDALVSLSLVVIYLWGCTRGDLSKMFSRALLLPLDESLFCFVVRWVSSSCCS